MEQSQVSLDMFTDASYLNLETDFDHLKMELKEVEHQLSLSSRANKH